MRKVHVVVLFLLFGLFVQTNSAFGQAQTFPTKAVRFVSSEAGGSTDIVVRILSAPLQDTWHQAVVIENRNVVVGGETVAHAVADGYTLLFSGSTFWISPLFQKMPFDAVRDFSPITMVNNSPSVILVQPTLPAQSVKDLVTLAKAKPGTLNYGTASTGSSGYLAAELLKSMAKIDIVRIQYKGATESITALLGGEVQMSFASVPSGMPYVRSGKLKALAITSTNPSALAPGVPTVASAGYPGYEVGSAIGAFAPAKTPKPIINQLNRDLVRVSVRPEVKEKLFGLGSEVVANSPEQFAAQMKSEIARVSKLIKETGGK